MTRTLPRVQPFTDAGLSRLRRGVGLRGLDGAGVDRLIATVDAYKAENEHLMTKLNHLRAIVGAAVADLENGDPSQARGDLTGALMDTGISTPIETTRRAVSAFIEEIKARCQ